MSQVKPAIINGAAKSVKYYSSYGTTAGKDSSHLMHMMSSKFRYSSVCVLSSSRSVTMLKIDYLYIHSIQPGVNS